MTLPQRFCLNHPNIASEGNCVQCHKPVCGACALVRDGKIFCSADCAGQYAFFYSRYKPEPKKSGLLGALVKLAAVVAVVAIGLFVGRAKGIGWCAAILRLIGL
jgi:hypothetical protein